MISAGKGDSLGSPEDWAVATIGELSPFVTSGSRGWARYYSDEGSPFIRIGNLSRETIYLDLEDLRYVRLPRNASSEAERSHLEDGDLLISITADVGVIGFVDSNLEKPAYINQHIALVRLNNGAVLRRFAAYYLASERPQRMFIASTDLGAKTGLNLKTVRNMRIALPGIAEQQAIVDALSDADDLLGALDRFIAKKRAIKQAAMQQLLTGTSRLPGFSGEWKSRDLGRYVKFLRHGSNSRAELTTSGSVRYLHYGDIHTSTSVYLDPQETSMPYLPPERARTLDRLQEGDLVMVDASEDIDGVGKSVEIVDAAGVELVAGLHTIAARFDKTVLADGFKAYLQFIPTFRDHLRRLAAGTKVFATQRAHIAGLALELPSVAEQTAIAAVLSDMSAEIVALERRREKTRAIKQGMMQQLLTGRVRLVEPGVEGESAA